MDQNYNFMDETEMTGTAIDQVSLVPTGIEALITGTLNVPGIGVDREDFLYKKLKGVCTEQQINAAIIQGTLNAGIPIKTIDKIAKDIVNSETNQTALKSFLAGMPGGMAMLATVPADIAQFYAHVIRVAQELAYLYGWTENFSSALSSHDESTKHQLVMFTLFMAGADAAGKALTVQFANEAAKISKDILAKQSAKAALEKSMRYRVTKIFSQKTAGKMMAKCSVPVYKTALPKILPVLGGFLSGSITYASFKSMAKRLQKHLSELSHMTPDMVAERAAMIIIESE